MRIFEMPFFTPWRARTRTILQMEFVECGAAALGIILDFHGWAESPQHLRVVCKVSRDGSSAGAILQAARTFGLEARAFRCTLEQLRTLQGPCIVFWDFNHYVVVEGTGRRCVYINDPASGRRAVSLEEFNTSFTGIVLTFQKGPNFRKGGRRHSVLGALRRRLEGQGLGLFYLFLSTAALSVPSMIAAVLPKVFFDAMLADGATHWFPPLLVGMAVTTVLLGTLTVLQQRALAKVETNLSLSAAGEFFWHLLRLPLTFFSQRHPGDLAGAVSANDLVASLLAGEVATNLVTALLAGAYLALMARYDLTLTAVVLAIAVLNAAALQWLGKRRGEDSQRIAKERGRLYGVAVSGVNSFETLKAMGSEGEFFDQWTGQHAELLCAEQDMQRSHIVWSTMLPLLTSLGAAAVLGVGGLRIMEGWLTLGMLVAFQNLMGSFLQPFHRLLRLGSQIQQIRGELHRLDDILDNSEDPSLIGGTTSPSTGRLTGDIEFRNVTFGFDPDRPLLHDFTLHITAGSRVALVGTSGSGKSTAAKLLAGLYRPWSGEIRLDGVGRDEWSRDVITNSIAMVDQDIVLFEGSVADNIAMMDDTVGQDAIACAARDAAIADEILSKPGAYAHQIGEMGRNLSGGQRQRIEIARALAAQPEILILDEATSALDPAAEREILNNLRARSCTCLVVAHRVSAIRECDQVVMLEAGRIVERGTHDELIRNGGKYAALIAD